MPPHQMELIPLKKLLAVPLIVVGVALFFWFSSSTQQPEGLDRSPPLVRTQPAEYSSVSESIEALGTVRAQEAIEITARVTGKVVAVHFSDNSPVEAGDVLVELDAARERAALREAQVVLQEDRRLLDHYQTLERTQAVSRTMLEEQRAKVAASEARVTASEAQLADFVISAPFSGLLGVRRVSQGALVSPGTLITTLDAIATVKVDFTVPERWLNQLVPGQSVAANSVAWPDRAFEGRVASIGSRVDPVTRAVSVHAEMDNDDLLLRPGMLLSLRLHSDARDALLVAEQALIQEGSERFVYVVNGNNRVERRTVRTGQRLPGRVEVIEGLNPGEQVVIEGSQSVRSGGQVRVAHANGAS